MRIQTLLGAGAIALAISSPALAQEKSQVSDPKWNPEYSKQYGLENQPISAEDFRQVSQPEEMTDEAPLVYNEEEPKKKDKSVWDRMFDFGPVGVDAFKLKIGPFVIGGGGDPTKGPPAPPTLSRNAKGTLHAKGTHSCWSNEALYTCDVELFDAFDCNEAGLRLKLMDCCPSYILNEKKLTNARSTFFKLKKCGIWADKEEKKDL